MKICTKCNINKDLIEFYKDKSKKSGYKPSCKECERKLSIISSRNYKKNNKEKVNEYFKQYREKNREVMNERSKKYNSENKELIKERKKEFNKNNKVKINKTRKIYREKNKEKINEKNRVFQRHKMKTDFLFKLKTNIRNSINISFNKKNILKENRTTVILGCTFLEFKIYIESKFESWMTWNNHGKYNGTLNFGWDLDHIIPISKALTKEDLLKLNHFSNFQPLCSKINRDIKKNN